MVMSKQYRMVSGIDGFYRLYENGVEVFECHDDEINKALHYFDSMIDCRLEAMVMLWQASDDSN